MPLILIILSTIIVLIITIWTIYTIIRTDAGNEKIRYTAQTIQCMAKNYLMHHDILNIIVILFLMICFYILLDIYYAVSFTIGALIPILTNWIALSLSTCAHSRAAHACSSSLTKTFTITFKTGAATGICVTGLALITITLYYCFLTYFIDNHIEPIDRASVLITLGFGISITSIITRLSSAILSGATCLLKNETKEKKRDILEKDLQDVRIANKINNNIRNNLSTGSDLLESHIITLIATIILATFLFTSSDDQEAAIYYPLSIGAISLIASLIGSFFSNLGVNNSIQGALYKGILISSSLFLITLFPLTLSFFGGLDTLIQTQKGTIITALDLFLCSFIGLSITVLLIWVTEYYTRRAYQPVRSIAKASEKSNEENLLQGLAISYEAAIISTLILIMGIAAAYILAGIFGIAIAICSHSALSSTMITYGVFSSMTRNAHDILLIENISENTSQTLHALKTVSVITRAISKNYAILSASLCSLILFLNFTEHLHFITTIKPPLSFFKEPTYIDFSLSNPILMIGLALGGLLPYLFKNLIIRSAIKMRDKIAQDRHSYSRKEQMAKGKAKDPGSQQAIRSIAHFAYKETILTLILSLLMPFIILGMIVITINLESALTSLNAMLISLMISTLLMTLSMIYGGGTWNNAKNYIEDGHYGGKGSQAHQVSIAGNKISFILRNTISPSISTTVKIINMIALLLLLFLTAL